RAGDGDRPRVGQERVERVEALAQPALDVVDGVDEPRVHLDLPPPDHTHAARPADPRLVVAVDIGAHRQLRLVLLGVEQPLDLRGVAHRVVAPRDRAGTRARLPAIAVTPKAPPGLRASHV